MRSKISGPAVALALLTLAASMHAQTKIDPTVLSALKWRSIGQIGRAHV